MKQLFYATRLDKDGNKLTTSYTSKKLCDQYGGGADALKSETLYFADLETNTIAENMPEYPIVRSVMINNVGIKGRELGGKFRLFGKINGNWDDNSIGSYSNYGAANTMMKALINEYDALIILTHADGEDNRPSNTEIEGIM